jgi:hypothetical protein
MPTSKERVAKYEGKIAEIVREERLDDPLRGNHIKARDVSPQLDVSTKAVGHMMSQIEWLDSEFNQDNDSTYRILKDKM